MLGRVAAAVGTLAACLGPPSSAGAVVGGREEGGALARSSVMVLNARGGVCSGVVLGPAAVLTAAHCVAGAGEIRIHFRRPDGSAALLEPSAVAVHPGYDRGAVAGRRRSVDLALLRSGLALPEAFAPATLSGAAPRAGKALTLAGYGVAREGEGRSTGTFRSARLAVVEPYGPSTILISAADPARGGAGACEGDSGGPIALGSGEVVAVSSWAGGDGARRCGAMSQGIRLGPQRGWIDGTLSGWSLAPAAWR